jgi:ABC-type transport system involved in cytochrome c biogenesis permease subunit
MVVEATLSVYSDWTYGAAVAVYVLAAVLYLAEHAFGRATVRAAQVVRVPELVGAGVATTPPTGIEPAAEPAAERSRTERIGRMAVAVTVLGLLLHATSLLLRGLSVQRVPWGNMYEFGALLSLFAVGAWLVLLHRFPIRRLGAFVLLPTIVVMFLGGTVLYADAAPVQPALQSYWLAIHVFTIASSSGVLLVPGVASVLYLVDLLDRIAYRATIFAFPVYTFGVITGAIWAESAWGRFWGWDPKETCAFVAWVVYAAYLHSRATAGWRGSRAAAINAIGLAVVVFNLFFVNLVIAGLHSYAGLS